MGYSKPTVQLDWILSDDPTKMTIVSAPNQLLGHVSDTAADPKIFNWMWNRVSHWITFLDNTFDSSGNNINAPNSTKITETVSPAASTVTLDAGGIKSWDGSSNAIFSVTEPGVVTIGYSGNDIISLTAGVLSVATATSVDLVKLHAITPSAADINPLLGANGNGLIVADVTKLADIDASAAEIDQLDGVTVGGTSTGDIATIDDTQTLTNKTLTSPKINEDVVLAATSTELDQLNGVSVGGNSAGDIVTINDTQTLTNKTIDADNSTISNLEHGSEVDNLTTSHGATGAVVGTTNIQTLTNKTLTSPKINEDVVLTSTSTEIDAAVGAGTTNAIIGDSTPGRRLRCARIKIRKTSTANQWEVTWVDVFNTETGWSKLCIKDAGWVDSKVRVDTGDLLISPDVVVLEVLCHSYYNTNWDHGTGFQYDPYVVVSGGDLSIKSITWPPAAASDGIINWSFLLTATDEYIEFRVIYITAS